MTLRELIESNNYKKVFNFLYQTYFKGKPTSFIIELDLKFYRLYSLLKKLPKSEQKVIKLYLTQTVEGNPSIDVCLFHEVDDEILPLDFLNIDDIIDTEVYKALNINDYETLAHILYYLNSLEDIT
jgi:hypothetical protein